MLDYGKLVFPHHSKVILLGKEENFKYSHGPAFSKNVGM